MNKKSVYRNVRFSKHTENLQQMPEFDQCKEKENTQLNNALPDLSNLSDQMVN